MRIVLASILFTGLGFGFPASALAADAPPAPPPAAPAPMVVAASPDCGCCPAPNPCRRSRLEIQGHLALPMPDPDGDIAIDTGGDDARWDAVDYEPEFGGRVAWTFPWCSWDVTVAGTYWGTWEDETTTFGSLTSTPFPGGPPGTNPPDTLPVREEATLWDVNLTFTKPWTCTRCFTSRWGFGVRYFSFEEEAAFSFDAGAAAPVIATLGAEVEAQLLAATLVAEGTWKLSGCWDVLVSGSVFAGWLHREGETFSEGFTPLTGTTAEDDDFGYGGEVEAALRWHPSACWSLSVGYGLLVLGNMPRAHEALDFTDSLLFDIGPVFSDDVLLVHRVFVGVAFSF